MGKRYRKDASPAALIFLLIGILIYGIYNYWWVVVIALVLIIILVIVVAIINKKYPPKQPEKTATQRTNSIYKRKRLITPTEIAFGNAIKKAIPNGYRLYPQICLASIINKTTNNHYVSELFRIIDFGIFDENYNVILLIEINDSTHRERKRIARDYKVENICNAAGIPLIHFWTEYGVNQEYISKRLQSYFPIAQATENK